MDGRRLREFWSHEAEAMFKTYRQFEILIPAAGRKGAGHPGEDGRYVESLLKSYIKKYLPGELEVLTGFVLRPAVHQIGGNGGRRKDQDRHSTQLDLIVYDTAHYPVFQRMEGHVIVPPEGVIGVISVKKNLYAAQLETEIRALEAVGRLCTQKSGDEEMRGPFLGLVSMDSGMNCSIQGQGEKVFTCLEKCFPEKGRNRYDWMPGYIGVLSKWSICKERPKSEKKAAEYILFEHRDEEAHLGFQMIIRHILGVYYDKSRGNHRTLGFTAFEPGRGYDKKLGMIPYVKEHGDFRM
ncbi:DUF6602 domain-containing protein [Lachnospiraceae bacterium 62-35]